METISGGPSKDEVNRYFEANQILEAAKLNKALENWVVTEVPGEDEGEIGDVVFVTGPGDGGSSSSVGGGKVLQVVHEQWSTEALSVGTTWEDTGLSATITPSSATSKILVLVSQHSYTWRKNSSTGMKLRIVRDGTVVFQGVNNHLTTFDSTSTDMGIRTTISMHHQDFPSTTAAITYGTEMAGNGSDFGVETQKGGNPSTITLIEVAA